MPTRRRRGCTLRITRIPEDMALATLRQQLATYGVVTEWLAHRQKVVAYVTYATPEEASRAMHEMHARQEKHRLLLDFSCMSLG